MDGADTKGSTRRRAGDLENGVLAALWSARDPLTPREVHRLLGCDLAYNTVQTTLVRLREKGLVRRIAHGRGHRYAPTKDPEELAAERMHRLLEAGPDRRSVLRRFVDTLESCDERILRDLLNLPPSG